MGIFPATGNAGFRSQRGGRMACFTRGRRADRTNRMNTHYSDQPLEFEGASIFLAGPTPRSDAVRSWRPEAVKILGDLGFAGTVLIPERPNWKAGFDYQDQVEWEFAGLERADALLFWVPRDLESLPGFTTNVEFGRYVASGRMVYGRPARRPHNRYLDWLYVKCTGLSPHETLLDAARDAVRIAAHGRSAPAP